MNKLKVKLATIGHLPLHLDLMRVANWKSNIFEIAGEVENYPLRGDSDGPDWQFSDSLLEKSLPQLSEEDFLLAIVNVPIENNFYARRLGNKQIVFTFHCIKDVLAYENIPLENAILRVLYAATLLYGRAGNRIPEFDETPGFTHDETRGCLFDMNGIKSDIVVSCDAPIVCEECQERLRHERVSREIISTTQHEIKAIRKELYYRILGFVKRHPITALLFSSAFALALGVASSLVASFVYDAIKAHP